MVAEARDCESKPSCRNNPVTIVQEATPESDNAYERMSGPLAEEGFYAVGGTYFKVQRAVHGSGRLYAKELVELPVRDESGQIVSKGRWEMARGVVYRLRKTDLLAATMRSDRGTADAEALGVRPRSIAEVLAR